MFVVPRPLLPIGAAAALAGCFVDRTEVECERALTHIGTCCDVWSLPDVCTHSEGGLPWGEAREPLLTVDEAVCIRKKSCRQLRETCAWAERMEWDTGDFADSGHAHLQEAAPQCVP